MMMIVERKKKRNGQLRMNERQTGNAKCGQKDRDDLMNVQAKTEPGQSWIWMILVHGQQVHIA